MQKHLSFVNITKSLITFNVQILFECVQFFFFKYRSKAEFNDMETGTSQQTESNIKF